ncbi:septal ring lytic transglycosylase RlpA family lipoprotein [Pollutimonas subterranea]|uniref:Endolytic peptidoglycan transglycosylase RlpA n=1 Tax=Pollutimonas subterranea TaxID=2045210 RepID=A0A2N4U1G4_9BURK|nr:septal ring lytic transglycosylase RlpA family protein [Pollutimonas subterranea]PLC48863.1 septal ring lytic transglycosylase RlpA family lipoprotein [Pollutimonas subterranea]
MTSRRLPIPLLALCIILAILAGCSTPKKTGTKGSTTRGGGYYMDDGPGSNIPPGIENIPDAVPQIEVHAPANFRPYVVFGKKYVPVSDEKPFREEGTASWYGRKFHGKKTANGEVYDMYAMSAAHPTLPIPSYARVTHANTGKSVVVRVNDRGPFHSKRIIDVSYVAASKLGLIGPGSGQVIVEAITNDDIRNTRVASTPAAPRTVRVSESRPAETRPAPVKIAQMTQPLPDALEVLRLSEARPTEANPDALHALKTDDQIGHITPAGTGTQAEVVQDQPSPGQIYLQFGAFSASHTANGLAQKINQQISQVESRPAKIRTVNELHKVQIGPYSSRTEAVNAAFRIREVTGIQATLALS